METISSPSKQALERKLAREILARKSAEEILDVKSRELYFVNKQLELQRDRLDVLHTEMKDSLAYSKRIQQSLLPSYGIASTAVKDHFILYHPKDIVSGDFYWKYDDIENKRLIVATADCTGHGVPGAFMSIIGKQALDQAVIQQEMSDPAEILHSINRHLASFLQKEMNTHIQDGMDISIYCIDYSYEDNKELYFSGALNSIYIIREQEILELKADRVSLGYSFQTEKTPYTTVNFKLESNDTIYSYTDGFQDQFGGPMGKKLKKRTFKESLIKYSNQNLKSQHDVLENILFDWKGELEQVDDICVIGVKIK
jgi:serine phosphatase RsbU (regulator of sigma subunit)